MESYKILNDINKDIVELRSEVFILEQNVPIELELESNEGDYVHCCLYLDDKLIAYARVLNSSTPMIGRVCVKKEYRHQGYGKQIMDLAERQIFLKPATILIHAQKSAQAFYEKLGYIPYGEYFTEANIPHIFMKKLKC